MYWAEKKNRKYEIELRFWIIDFEYSVLKRVSIFRASFNIPIRDRVWVRVLFAFLCLPIVCSANPQSAFYWPVIERCDTNCLYVYTPANTT